MCGIRAASRSKMRMKAATVVQVLRVLRFKSYHTCDGVLAVSAYLIGREPLSRSLIGYETSVTLWNANVKRRCTENDTVDT